MVKITYVMLMVTQRFYFMIATYRKKKCITNICEKECYDYSEKHIRLLPKEMHIYCTKYIYILHIKECNQVQYT